MNVPAFCFFGAALCGMVVLVEGCATHQECFTAHSSSLKVVNGAGTVLLDKQPETVTYCPAWVGVAASGATP